MFDEPVAPPGPHAPPALDVEVVDLRGRAHGGEAGGPRFGDLVHAMLAAVPFEAGRPAIDDMAAVHGRILSATQAEIAAAATTIERVLAHPLLVRARVAAACGACRRETPVTCTFASGVLVEGIVDLAFEEHDTWTVIDYKTDRELSAAGAEQYYRQVALYAHAISQATGKQASGILVRV